MTLEKVTQLINTLKKENETNTPEERDFNERWIEQLRRAIQKSVEKNWNKILKRAFNRV